MCKCVHAAGCEVDWCYHREPHPYKGGLCDMECNNGDIPHEAHCIEEQ